VTELSLRRRITRLGPRTWFFLVAVPVLAGVALLMAPGGDARSFRLQILAAGMLFAMLITVGATVRGLIMKVRIQAELLKEDAGTDSLTGATNRSGLHQYLVHELIRTARHPFPISLAVVDFDHFHSFVDRLGRSVGDLTLTKSVAAWQVELRAGDCLARYEREEFVVVLPVCALDEAEVVIERLRRAMPGPLTCSAGLVEWNGTESAKELVNRARAALHAAKEAGRDRTVARVEETAMPVDAGESPAIPQLQREISQAGW
jgi:diguanylate cyclase (GGDEF)-like protein